jgi:hypothetical protein
MAKERPKKSKQKVHKSIEGFEIHINEFGELVSSIPTEKINNFLNENLDDKKLKNND